jgi:hypothetical protein
VPGGWHRLAAWASRPLRRRSAAAGRSAPYALASTPRSIPCPAASTAAGHLSGLGLYEDAVRSDLPEFVAWALVYQAGDQAKARYAQRR